MQVNSSKRKRLSAASKLWIFPLLLCWLLILPACGLFEDDEYEPPSPRQVNEKLSKFFYWGRVDNTNWVPNQGDPRGEVLLPTWTSDSEILASTATIVDSEVIRGVFKIELDPTTLTFSQYTAFRFADYIWKMEYSQAKDELILISIDERNNARIVSGQLTAGQLVVKTEWVSSDWDPSGLSYWPGKEGIIFYGKKPDDDISGFYWRTPSGLDAFKDSLLWEGDLDIYSARGLSVSRDGKYLIFGQNDFQPNNRSTELFKLDLSQDLRTAEFLMERDGTLTTIVPHPSDSAVVLLNYSRTVISEYGPGDQIEIVNIDDLSSVVLDIEISRFPGEYTGASFPSWCPDGDVFVFSAWEMDDLGDRISSIKLWTYDMR